MDHYVKKRFKVFRGNYKPNEDKDLPKAIKKRSRLKKKATKTKSLSDISEFKTQQKSANKLNKEEKLDYFQNFLLLKNILS